MYAHNTWTVLLVHNPPNLTYYYYYTGVPFDPVDFTLVTTVVIAVGAGVLGSLLLVAVTMTLCLVCILGWRRYKKMGKHKPLIEEQAFERQKTKRSGKKRLDVESKWFGPLMKGVFSSC